jgi:hypothetical protein
MKTATAARLAFGASAALFGVLCLLWYDAETWQALVSIWRWPFGAFLGAGLMLAQIAGGLGIQHPRTLPLASVALSVVYALFALACIPGILDAPTVYAQYDGLFEQLCLLSGAIALYAGTETDPAVAALCARLGLGVSAASCSLAQIFYFHFTASLVPHWIPPSQTFWAVATTIAFALAALAILIHRQARLALRLMALMLALFAAVVWVPLLLAHPHSHLNWSEFALTCLMAAATWSVAELRTL